MLPGLTHWALTVNHVQHVPSCVNLRSELDELPVDGYVSVPTISATEGNGGCNRMALTVIEILALESGVEH